MKSKPKYDWKEFDIYLRGTIRDQMYTKCPKCSPYRATTGGKRQPCLGVNTESSSWHCVHCGFSGSLYKGVMNEGDINKFKKGDISFRPKEDYTLPQIIVPKSEYPKNVLTFFESRKISEETIKEAGIFATTRFFPTHGAKKPAIAFPYYKVKGGEIINVKYKGPKIDGKKAFIQEKNAEKIFYGLEDVQPKLLGDNAFQYVDTIVIVEGEMDRLACKEAGIFFCISVPDGAPDPTTKNYTSKFDFLESGREILKNADHIVLAVDDDEAGRRLEEELAKRIGKEKCYRIKYPKGCKDMNQVLIDYDATQVKRTLLTYYPYPINGIYSVTQITDKVDKLFDKGVKPGYKLHWKSLRDLYRVAPREWTVVTAIPGSGKTKFVECMEMHLAREYGLKFGIYSPEHDMEHIVISLAEKYVNKPVKIRGIQQEGIVQYMSKEEYKEARDFIAEHFYFVYSNEEDMTMQIVLDKFKSLVQRHGIFGCQIDPYNQLDHSRPHHMQETEYISKQLTELTKFTRNTDTHVFLVAHPTKLSKVRDKDGFEYYPVATPYHIAGSAHFFNKTFNAVSIYRKGLDKETKIIGDSNVHIQKVKNKWNGRLGMGKLKFDTKTDFFYEED